MGVAAFQQEASVEALYDCVMQNAQRLYSLGSVTKEEFEETLRAHKDSLDDMKSEQRNKASAALWSAVP